MADIPVPSLTRAGWITEIKDKCDLLMSYYFYSDYSQSNFYLGNISSLPDIINKYGNEQNKIAFQMQDQMHLYLLRYFESVECSVTALIPEDPEDNRMQLVVNIVVGEKGVKYDFYRMLNVRGNTLTEIVERNNSGSLE